jgi:hypothetical protein
MALPEMKVLLEKIHNNAAMADFNKCIQIKEWRKEFVKEMNIAIDLAENFRKENDKGKVIAIPSKEELRTFFTDGLDLIDSYLSQYRVNKEN